MTRRASADATRDEVIDLDAVSAEWINSVLHGAGVIHGAEVVGLEAHPLSEALISRISRLELQYDRDEPGAPATLVAKCASREPSVREFALATGIYSREARFYAEVADGLPVNTPAVYHTAMRDPDFLLLMEDLQPAEEVDQLEGCTPDQAAIAVEQAAALHGGSWDDPRLLGLEWLTGGLGLWKMAAAQAPALQQAFRSHYEGKLEEEYLAVGDRLVQATDAWLALLDHPRCLWQGDFRLDNMLFGAAGGRYPLAVIDWQVVTLGLPATDVAFFLGCGIDSDLRRSHEQDLVRHYHEGLVGHGVEGYSWDQCWRDYRAQALCGFLGTLLAHTKAENTERGERLLLHMARGYARQIIDNDSFAALER